jgi:hypothetical protein
MRAFTRACVRVHVGDRYKKECQKRKKGGLQQLFAKAHIPWAVCVSLPRLVACSLARSLPLTRHSLTRSLTRSFALLLAPSNRYRSICKTCLDQPSGEGITDWLFASFCFNLFCRGINTAQLDLHSLFPTVDGFLVDLLATKTNMEGAKDEKKNCTGNSADPTVCLRTALAVRLLLWGHATDAADTLLFPGGNKAATFGARLQFLLKSLDCTQALKTAGIIAEVLGTHSLRKGGATLSTTGSQTCNVVAVCKRGDWSFGVTGAYFLCCNRDVWYSLVALDPAHFMRRLLFF